MHVPEKFTNRTLGCRRRLDFLLDPTLRFPLLGRTSSDADHAVSTLSLLILLFAISFLCLELVLPLSLSRSRTRSRSRACFSSRTGLFFDCLGDRLERKRLTDRRAYATGRFLAPVVLDLLDDTGFPLDARKVVPRLSFRHVPPLVDAPSRAFRVGAARRDARREGSRHEEWVPEDLSECRSFSRDRSQDPRDEVFSFRRERDVFRELVNVVANFAATERARFRVSAIEGIKRRMGLLTGKCF